MGSINTTARRKTSNSNILPTDKKSRFYTLLSCHRSARDNDFRHSGYRRDSRLKKKVLLLGLDGVGKTELFTYLIHDNNKRLKLNALARPTLGYNVETIKLRSHCFRHRFQHKIALWDCGGQSSVRPLWSYHYSNTSLVLWLINVHDRSRLDASLHLLSQILTEPDLNRVPVLIVLYGSFSDHCVRNTSTEHTEEIPLSSLEIGFRFLASLSRSHASSFKWQVISVKLNENNLHSDLKKIRRSFRELMDL